MFDFEFIYRIEAFTDSENYMFGHIVLASQEVVSSNPFTQKFIVSFIFFNYCCLCVSSGSTSEATVAEAVAVLSPIRST